jgi:hypothetical protein
VITRELDYGADFSVTRLAGMMAQHMPSISVGGFPVAGQPLVLARRDYDALLDATARLLNLQRKAIANLAPDSRGRLAALKCDPAAFPRFVADEQFELQHAIDMARADVILSPGGPRFIEFNVGGGFAGMVQFEVLRRIWADVGAARHEPPLAGNSPFSPLADLVTRTCAENGAPPSAVFLTSFDDSGRTMGELDSQLRFLREYAVPAEYADVRSLDPGHIMSRSPRPVGIVQLSEREAVDAGWDITALLDLVASGMTAIPSQSARLVDSKKVMALLSEGLPWMSDADHALVRRYIPWTRIVRDRIVDWAQRSCHIQQLLIAEKHRFVLKGSAGLSGKEVIFGAHCTPHEWEQLVTAALETEYYIAQEVVDSVRVPVRVLHDAAGSHEYCTVKMVVSPFCLGGIPVGCHVRMDPAEGVGLVTRSTGAFPGCLLGAPC